MADFRFTRLDLEQNKIRNVPIVVSPEGFWCCPSHAVLQKPLKDLNKPKPSFPPPIKSLLIGKTHTQTDPSYEKTKLPSSQLRSMFLSEDQGLPPPDTLARGSDQKEKMRKITVRFGQPETSDLKVVFSGKEGIEVRARVHRDVLVEHSKFFLEKLSKPSPVSSISMEGCDDIEIYIETIGLMYCKEVKQKLIKQSVPRVLRIIKASEFLGFDTCVISCLEYLEAVPWVGEEEEQNVVSLVRRLPCEIYGVGSIMRRLSSTNSVTLNDTLAQILQMVLRSGNDRGRREMKSLVLRLLRENRNTSSELSIETLYGSCRSCLCSVLSLLNQASEPEFLAKLRLEVDSLLWLVDILAVRDKGDEFVLIWASQVELAELHSGLASVLRHPVSYVTSRLFVGIGKGEFLPTKDARQKLLNVWLKPLFDDYKWLQNGWRSFDRKAVEEGIGQTILTLPLEDQQANLLSWMGSFLKVGDDCPNLKRAFEVWSRRAFIRPSSLEQQERERK